MASSNLLELSPVPTSEPDANAALLTAVADPVRWRVLRHLAAGQACVCELQQFAPVAGSLMSYHLRILREAELVVATRRGRWVYYALATNAAGRLLAALPLVPQDQPPAPDDGATEGRRCDD